MKKYLIFITFLLLICLKVQAAEYYVSPGGDDSKSGTSVEPFKTIQKAADIVEPGDTVIVDDGVYTSDGEIFVNVSRGGKEGEPITFKSKNEHGAVLDGRNSTRYGFILFDNVNYINIEDFEIKNFIHSGIHINNNSNSNIVVSGNHIHDMGRRCIIDPEEGGGGGLYWRNVSNSIIKNNKFHDLGRYAAGENGCNPPNKYYENHDHALYLNGVNNITVNNNIFYNINRGWGVHIYDHRSSNIYVYNNTFDFGNPYRGGSHIVLASDIENIQIKNNIFGGDGGLDDAIDNYPEYGTFSGTITNNIVDGGGGKGLLLSSPPLLLSVSNNMINTDPLMKDPKGRDFSLQSDSPAIDQGVTVGLNSDYFKNAIINKPDIGAIEFQESKVVPPEENNSGGGTPSQGGGGTTTNHSVSSTSGGGISHTTKTQVVVNQPVVQNTAVLNNKMKIQFSSKILRTGLRGEEVRLLQTYLTNYNYGYLTADGIFGLKTKSAVIAFQRANKLVPDGIVGNQTKEAINR